MSKRWRAVFALEILICLATVLAWVFAPADLLRGLYGLEGAGPWHLLLQSANVVFCAYVYLYARILFAKEFRPEVFRWLQEAMAIGDVVILATSPLLYRDLQPPLALFAPMVGMAALWLSIRVVYLLTTRRPSPSPRHPELA